MRIFPFAAFFFTLIFLTVAMGFFWGGVWGAAICGGLIFAWLLFHFSFCAERMTRAHRVLTVSGDGNMYGLDQILARISFRMNLPEPRAYQAPDALPYAFTVGRNPFNASLVISTGLLGLLDENELEAVLVHEYLRTSRGGVWRRSFLASLAYGLSLRIFAGHEPRFNLRSLLMLPLYPVLSGVLRVAEESRAEILAVDGAVARLLKDPNAYARALHKIGLSMSHGSAGHPFALRLAAAHLYIVNPLVKHPWLNWLRRESPMPSLTARVAQAASQGGHIHE